MTTRTTGKRETLEERLRHNKEFTPLVTVVRAELDRLARQVRKIKGTYLRKRKFSTQTKKRLAYVLALNDVLAMLKELRK